VSICDNLDNELPEPGSCGETIVTSEGEKPVTEFISDAFEDFILDPEFDFPEFVTDTVMNERRIWEWLEDEDEEGQGCPERSADEILEQIYSPTEWTEVSRITEVVEVSHPDDEDFVIEVERITSITFESGEDKCTRREMTLVFNGWE
jgi:hypothetical protein